MWGENHEYTTIDGRITSDYVTKGGASITGTNTLLYFIYDNSGLPIGFEVSYSSTYPSGVYTYQKNLQGDVIGVVDSDGNQVASYSYDAWGAITSSSGTIADINPIRYKGYYYDSDTGMYYLQSRYYDPALRRFINLDAYCDTGTGVLGTNMYAYCNNSCVVGYDPTGEWDASEHNKMVVNSSSSLSSNYKKLIGKYDQLCDKEFKNKKDKYGNYISYPFHSRSAATLTKSIKHLYNYARDIKKNKKKKRFSYGDLIKDYFSAYDRSKNTNNRFTTSAEEANFRILNYVNKASSYTEQSSILMGFCMHMLQDFYAHQIKVSVYKKSGSKWNLIRKNKQYIFATTEVNALINASTMEFEDNKSVLPWRYSFSVEGTNQMLDIYAKNKKIKKITLKTDSSNTNMYSTEMRFKNNKYKFASYYQKVIFTTY